MLAMKAPDDQRQCAKKCERRAGFPSCVGGLLGLDLFVLYLGRPSHRHAPSHQLPRARSARPQVSSNSHYRLPRPPRLQPHGDQDARGLRGHCGVVLRIGSRKLAGVGAEKANPRSRMSCCRSLRWHWRRRRPKHPSRHPRRRSKRVERLNSMPQKVRAQHTGDKQRGQRPS